MNIQNLSFSFLALAAAVCVRAGEPDIQRQIVDTSKISRQLLTNRTLAEWQAQIGTALSTNNPSAITSAITAGINVFFDTDTQNRLRINSTNSGGSTGGSITNPASFTSAGAMSSNQFAQLKMPASSESGGGYLPMMGITTWGAHGGNWTSNDLVFDLNLLDSSGLHGAGYNLFIIDSGLWLTARNGSGDLVADPLKIVGGNATNWITYLHNRGFKGGFYGQWPLNNVEVGAPGNVPSYIGFEQQDARMIANSGADYVKYDTLTVDYEGEKRYIIEKFGSALRETGRDIIYQSSVTGTNKYLTWFAHDLNIWMYEDGTALANQSGGLGGSPDFSLIPPPFNYWAAENYIYDVLERERGVTGPGHRGFTDEMFNSAYSRISVPPGAVLVGGGSPVLDLTYTNLIRTEMGMHAILAQPLILSWPGDPSGWAAATTLMNSMYGNSDVIAIDQDSGCDVGRLVYSNNLAMIFVKGLGGPSGPNGWAVAFQNRNTNAAQTFAVGWTNLLSVPSSTTLNVRDCFSQADIGTYSGAYSTTVAPFGCNLFKFTSTGTTASGGMLALTQPSTVAVPPLGFNVWGNLGCSYSAADLTNILFLLDAGGLHNAGYKLIETGDGAWASARSSGKLIGGAAYGGDMAAWSRFLHSKNYQLGLFGQWPTPNCTAPSMVGSEQTDANSFTVDYQADAVHLDVSGTAATKLSVLSLYGGYVRDSGRAVALSSTLTAGQGFENWFPALLNTWRYYDIATAAINTGADPNVPNFGTLGDPDQFYQAELWLLDKASQDYGSVSPSHFSDPGIALNAHYSILAAPENVAQTAWTNLARTDMAMRSILALPIILSWPGDMVTHTNASLFMWTNYGNSDCLAVNQDPACIMGKLVYSNALALVYVKPLGDVNAKNGWAVCLNNRSTNSSQVIGFGWTNLSLALPSTTSLLIHNCSDKVDVTTTTAAYSATVPAYGSILLTATIPPASVVTTNSVNSTNLFGAPGVPAYVVGTDGTNPTFVFIGSNGTLFASSVVATNLFGGGSNITHLQGDNLENVTVKGRAGTWVGATNSLDFNTNAWTYVATTSCSITSFVNVPSGVWSTAWLKVSNSSGSDIVLYIPGSTPTVQTNTSLTIPAGKQGKAVLVNDGDDAVVITGSMFRLQ